MIAFYSENTPFILKNKQILKRWLNTTAANEKHSITELSYIFCSDKYLLKLNKQFLNHDYYTDIITFQHDTTKKEEIAGDLFISIDRVKDNAKQLNLSFEDELHRVMVHGLLHLIGFGDKTKPAKLKMTQKENEYLALLK